MRYIFPIDAIKKLGSLRKKYEKEEGVDLAVKPSAIGLPIFMGGTDVVTRNKQIKFLEKILVVLKANLQNLDAIQLSPKEQGARKTALVYCCLLVHQITKFKWLNIKSGN